MEKQRSIKILSVVALIVAILGLTVAFAILSEKLEVTGTGSVLGNESNNTWDIHFENLSDPIIEGSSAKVTSEFKIVDGTKIENFGVSLSESGDSVTYTFDVVNSGKVDAKLSKFTMATPSCSGNGDNAQNDAENLCKYLKYTLEYSDGTQIVEGDILNSNSSKNLTLTIKVTDGHPTITDDVYISFKISKEEPYAVKLQYSQN